MIMFNFFNSYVGMFVTQAFCHSMIASVISDQALRAWNVGNPIVRQRFRLIVVLVPVFSFPLFQALVPGRSSLEFRLVSLLDANRWMNIEILGVVSIGALFLAMLAVTSLVFVFQEMIPILFHTVQSRNLEQEGIERAPDPFVEECCRALSIAPPEIVIMEDEELVIFSTTGRKPAVFISDGLTEKLTPGQLQASLAHELAHIARSRRPVLLAVFLLRMLTFFNPVSLVEFRRVVRNEEKICDDIALSFTKQPEHLIEALKKFVPLPDAPGPDAGKKSLFAPVPLEEYSHRMQLESRIARLAGGGHPNSGNRWPLFIITIAVITTINFFVV